MSDEQMRDEQMSNEQMSDEQMSKFPALSTSCTMQDFDPELKNLVEQII